MKKISIILLVISLVLLIIYGADTLYASGSDKTSGEHMGSGFLPISEAVRGGVFGGGAVALSIIAFFISRKEKSSTIAGLLIINGALIIAGMIIVLSISGMMNNANSNSSEIMRTVGSTIAMGAILVGLGIYKFIINKK